MRAGDRRCAANQALRLQTEDARAIQRTNPYRTPSLYAQRSPSTWMDRIEVPTFLVGQFQDEQTGGHFVRSLGELAGNDKVWLSLQNGVHADSLGPDTITRWVEFLKLYVADEIPEVPAPVLSLSGALYAYLAEAGASPVRQSRFAGTTDVAAARRAFERDPRVRLLMDNGAGPQGPGSIGSTWELGFDAWPVRQVRADALLPRRGAGPCAAPARRAPGRPRTSPIRTPDRPRRCRATARPTRGRRSRPTTGGRSRQARASASPRRCCRAT